MNSELATFASVEPQTKENLIFVDSTVENYQGLISATPDSELVILDPFSDGIEQISAELANYDNVAAVHLVSHGEPGSIKLGNGELNLDNFENYADELQGWSQVLSEEADILIYGCNIGAGEDGATLLEQIKDATEADLAASTDATGSSALGGDWEWEINTGTIESGLAFTPKAIEAYDRILALPTMMEHNNALLNLVPESNATHVAINNGGWFDSSTWENGQIPNDGADVLISNGVEVTYNQKSDARLDTLRVDGNLVFPSTSDSKMLIDTFVVSSQGKLDIGQANNPVLANKKVEIIFTGDTPLDTESDSQQLGRGLISHGQVEIHGADKLDFVGLSQDVNAGENELILDLPNNMTSPLGWQVGDQLVLGGTYHRFDGNDENNTRFHDEELTITAIDGNRISFTNNDITSDDNTVLRFDHQLPEGFEEENLQLYVANTTRNVTFETLNGENAPIDRRGHVMFMHNPDVRVENAGFYNLGRSDKSELVDDPGQNVDGTSGTGTNPRGRYPLHFHRTGAENINSSPSVARGNAVVDSPGWGIVQHDSHANIADNVVFDVAGAGIVAESGNEIGGWWNNLTMKITGDDENGFIPTKPEREELFDFGFKGEGYWVQGAAQVEMTDNIAISTAGGAMSIFAAADSNIGQYRDKPTFPVSNLPESLQSIASNGEDSIDVTNLPLRRFSGFEGYNSLAGIVFWTHMANTDGQLEFNAPGLNTAHDFRSVVDDFKLWNIVSDGVHFQYTTQVDLVDGLIVGQPDRLSSIGIKSNDPSQNHLYRDLRIEGFREGIQLPKEGDEGQSVPFIGSRLEDSYLANNTYNLWKYGGTKDPIEYFEIANSQFETKNSNQAPTAQFESKSVGSLAVRFDGKTSFDSDAPNYMKSTGNEIASWGWDLDNNGTVDKYGRQIEHYFDAAGTYQVNLTVWDSQGATDTVAQTIDVTSTEYGNLIIDGGFDSTTEFGGKAYRGDSTRAGVGWVASNWKKDSSLGNGGAAVVSSPAYGNNLRQIVLDNSIRKGMQNLALDIKNIEQAANANQITISVWGVDGQFNAGSISETKPTQVGALPMNAVNLLEETVGGETFDWTNFDWDLNFGDGYQYVLFDIAIQDVDSSKGDLVAIDNVEIK